jgi:hypothetical protein
MARSAVVQALVRAAFMILMAVIGFTVLDVMLAPQANAQDGETTVQGSQNSFGSFAATGTTGANQSNFAVARAGRAAAVTGINQSNFNGGPAANGTVTGSAQQLGSNRGTVSQSAEAKSGDPVAGGQVTGAVAGNVTVQNQNTAIGSIAVSGGAVALNVNQGTVGPSATAVGPAYVSQVGDNLISVALGLIAQAIEAPTDVALPRTVGARFGDASAGSQVTGAVWPTQHAGLSPETSIGTGGASAPMPSARSPLPGPMGPPAPPPVPASGGIHLSAHRDGTGSNGLERLMRLVMRGPLPNGVAPNALWFMLLGLGPLAALVQRRSRQRFVLLLYTSPDADPDDLNR